MHIKLILELENSNSKHFLKTFDELNIICVIDIILFFIFNKLKKVFNKLVKPFNYLTLKV